MQWHRGACVVLVPVDMRPSLPCAAPPCHAPPHQVVPTRAPCPAAAAWQSSITPPTPIHHRWCLTLGGRTCETWAALG
ncbi:hypothetical protein E2C01_076903 [Portunus trituberculatus]|uniref:Uncharacterized protein n=1 Tax=Portunus trituberculatus TaxID=210409 RepID=A0A5B7ICZ7_PORTR|nr:hypothetical protein [Portunus trituberculatus]